MEGEPKPGYRTDLKGPLPQHGKGWTQEKTVQDLEISQQAVTKAIQIAEAVEKRPELIKLKTGSAIIRDFKTEKRKERISDREKKAEPLLTRFLMKRIAYILYDLINRQTY